MKVLSLKLSIILERELWKTLFLTVLFPVQFTGTKYGCGGGGCGACTVMISRYNPVTKRIRYCATESRYNYNWIFVVLNFVLCLYVTGTVLGTGGTYSHGQYRRDPRNMNGLKNNVPPIRVTCGQRIPCWKDVWLPVLTKAGRKSWNDSEEWCHHHTLILLWWSTYWSPCSHACLHMVHSPYISQRNLFQV